MKKIPLLDLFHMPLAQMKFKSHVFGKKNQITAAQLLFFKGNAQREVPKPIRLLLSLAFRPEHLLGQNTSDHISEGHLLILPTHEVQQEYQNCRKGKLR